MPRPKPATDDISIEPLEPRLLLSVDPLQLGPLAEDPSRAGFAQPAPIAVVFESSAASALDDPLRQVTVFAAANEATVCDQLETGLAALRSALPDFAKRLDLRTLELPVLPKTLDQLFGFSAQLASGGLNLLPDIGTSTTLAQLVDHLTSAGYEVTGVQGGMADRQIPDTGNGSLIEARWEPGAGVSVKPAAGAQGETFNAASGGLLEGVGSVTAASASWDATTTATLGLSVVFGVDANGFFVRAEGLQLTAAVKGGATLSGTAEVAGRKDVALGGTAAVDATVRLAVPATAATLRVSDFAAQFASGEIGEAWSGTADAKLAFTLAPAALTFEASYAGASADPAAQPPTLKFSGQLTLDNVHGTDGAAVKLELAGKKNAAGGWDLTGGQGASQKLTFHEFDLKDLKVALTVDATQFGDRGDTLGTLSLDLANDVAKRLIPEWMSLKELSGLVQWPTLIGERADLMVTVSGDFEGALPETPIGFKGKLEDLTLAVHDGVLQLESLDEFEVEIPKCKLPDVGTIEGTLKFKLLRLDAQNKPIADGDHTTVVKKSMLYGMLETTFKIEGYGFDFRVGVSEVGLISAYFKVDAPLPVGGETGLSITSLWGEVTFGVELPEPTDAKSLTAKSLAPADKMSDSQWEKLVHEAMVNVLGAGSVGAEFKALLTHFTIEGGISIADMYAKNALYLDGTFQLDTAGHLMVGGTLNLLKLPKKTEGAVEGGKLPKSVAQLEAKLFFNLAELRKVFDAGPAPEKALMIYADITNTKLKAPPVSLYGDLAISGLAEENPSIAVTGGIVLSADGFANLEFKSTSTFRALDATHYEYEIDGQAVVTGFGEFSAMDGLLKVDVDDQGILQIYGGLAVKPENVQKLQHIGVDVDGVFLWRVNFTQSAKQVTLHLPGEIEDYDLDLPSASIGMLLEGVLTLSQLQSNWLVLHGAASFYETPDSLDVVFDGQVLFGPTGQVDPAAQQGDALLVFETEGLLHFDLWGIAGELTLHQQTGSAFKALGIDAGSEVVLQLNTSGRDVTHTFPSAVKQLYPALQIPDQINLPGVPPEILGGHAGDRGAAWAYAGVTGSLTFGDATVITGDFAIVAATDKLEFRLDRGRVNLGPPEQRLMQLTASGSLRVDANGAVGALTVDLPGSSIVGDMLQFSGTAKWLINTTQTEHTLIDGTQVPASRDGNPYSELIVDGTLALKVPTADFATLTGHHTFRVVSNAGEPGYHLALSSKSNANEQLRVLNAGAEFFTATYAGAGYVDETGLAMFLGLQGNTLGEWLGLANSFESLALGINTTAQNLAVRQNGDEYVFTATESTTPGAGALAVLPSRVGAQIATHEEVSLFDSFRIDGGWTFTLDDNVWTLDIEGDFELHAPSAVVPHAQEKVLVKTALAKTFQLTLPGLVFQEDIDVAEAVFDLPELSATGALSLVVNTTKADFAGHAGPYAALVLAEANLTIEGFTFSGGLTFAQDGLSAMSATGQFDTKLTVAGATLFSGGGVVELHAGFDGLAGRVVLEKPTMLGVEFQSPAQAGREFFRVDFNTSSSAFTLLNGDQLRAGPYAVAHLNSTLTFANFQPVVLDGEFNLDSTGQLQVDASFNAYLVSKNVDPKPLISVAVTGGLTHTALGTTGTLLLKTAQTGGGFDFPASWDMSLVGDEHQSLSLEFNVQHGGAAAAVAAATTAAADPKPALTDGVRVTLLSRVVVGAQQINGTFYFSWKRGKELVLVVDGSTYVGFGHADATGKPEVVLMGLDVKGLIAVSQDGIIAGFEASFKVGEEQPKLMTDLGLNEGLGAEAKLYLRINTTGEAAPAVPGMDLTGFAADEKFAVYLGGSIKISSFELNGIFAFTLFADGFRLQAVASHSLSLLESTGSDHSAGTNLTLCDSQVTGLLQVRRDGVIGFFDAHVNLLDVELAGFALSKDEVDGFIRINTTGKAVDVNTLGANVPVTIDPSFKELPAGHYAQLIVEANWASPPFVGIQFDDWLVVEIVDNAFVLSGKVGVKAQLFNFEGVSADLFDLKASIAAVITKDRQFALAGVLDGDPLSSLQSDFLKTDLSSGVQASLQIKTIEGAIDLTTLIPSRLLAGMEDAFQFEAGQYARIQAKTTLDTVALGVGVAVTGETTLEFKHELIAKGATPAEDSYRTWLEAVVQDQVKTELSVLGTLTETDTLAFYVGSDGLAFLLERDAGKSRALHSVGFDFTVNTLKLSFNTTGREIAIADETVSRDEFELGIDGTLQAGVIALTGDYAFEKQSDGFAVTSAAKLTSLDKAVADVTVAGLLGKDDFGVTATGAFAVGEKPVAALDGSVTVGIGTKTGFSGQLAGDLWFLERKVKSISESFQSSGIDVAFDYDLSAPLPAPMNFVVLAGKLAGHITNQSITVDDKVAVKVRNTTVDEVAFKLDTAAKTWSLNDHIALSLAKAKIGPAEVKVDLSFEFNIGYANGAIAPGSGVTLSGEASATVKGHGVTVKRGPITLAADAVRISFPLQIKVPVLGTLFKHTVTIDLTKSSLIQGSDLGGGTVFLDTNGNRLLDPGEVAAQADAEGYFTFSDADNAGALGLLAPFDLNQDGLIENAEGVFVVQGGTDQNSGLPNLLDYAFSAESYGSVFQVVYSPLLHLQADLVRVEGLESEAAWNKIHVAFGLPSWIAVPYFDHNLDESTFGDEGAYREVEAAYAQVNAFLINASASLQQLLPDCSAEQIQTELGRQLAHLVGQQDSAAYEAALRDVGGTDGGAPTIGLNDPATAQALVTAAFVELSGATPTAAQKPALEATAHAIAEQCQFIDVLRTADVERYTETMAMVKTEAQQRTAPQLRRIAAGEADAVAFVDTYGREAIEAAIVSEGFDGAEVAPVIGAIPDFAGTPAELPEFGFAVTRFDGSANPLTWQITSSDEALLPSDRIALVEQDGQWTLKLDPDAAHRGTATVTLVATDTLGHSTTTRMSVQLLPQLSVGLVTPVASTDAAYIEVPITLDAPSNEPVTGTYTLAGAAVEQGLVADAAGTFTIAAGERGAVVRILQVRTPFGAAAPFTITIGAVTNARTTAGAESAQSLVPSIPQPGGARAPRTRGFADRELSSPDESIVREIRSAPAQPATERIQPGNLRYLN